jgi:hypothetical protein
MPKGNLRTRALASFGLSLIATVGTASAAPVTFVPHYRDGATEGFNDPALGAQRKSAFTFALGLWSQVLNTNYAGETININATFDDLGGNSTKATLGSAGPTFTNENFASTDPRFVSSTWYGDPLANHLAKKDLFASASPDDQEITAQFNSAVDGSVLGSTNWYYGTNASPGGDIDFVSVVLHEIGHGLNFTDSISSSTGQFGSSDGNPGIFDRFLENAGGTRLTALTPAQRAAALTSGNVFWGGAQGIAGNGGIRPEMYAPNPYESGSSISHLDETTFPNDLMSPMYSGPDHTISAMERGIFADMGWDVSPIPEPVSLAVAALGGVLLLGRRGRRDAA